MKQFSFRLMACVLIALPAIFTACTKNECGGTYTYVYYEPVFKSKAEARSNIKSNAPREIKTPGKIYIIGKMIFLNEQDKGIHVIDNQDASHPKNIAFIDIPGNIDIAVKGNILYADMYTDLVAINIADPKNVKVTKIVDTLFPYRNWGPSFASMNSDKVIVDWIRKDSTIKIDCEASRFGPDLPFRRDIAFFSPSASSSQTSRSPIGMGGSMARFTIMNDRLYTVSDFAIRVYNIISPYEPAYVNRVPITWGIETIYPFKNKLFIGSQQGMYIYDVSNPDLPSRTGQFNHVRTCDPVVADDDYAYVTLRSGSVCAGFTNQLDIINVKDFNNPTLAKTYPMATPHGLSKDGDLLFICHGSSGLKLYDVSNVDNLKTLDAIEAIDAYDVIAFDKIAVVTGKDGLYQYSYSNNRDLRLLSKLTVSRN